MFRIAWALLLIAVSQGAFAHPSACLDNYRHLAEPPQGGLGPNVVRAPRLSEVKQGRITHDAFGQSVPGKLGARYRTIRPIVENLTANAASATHLFVKFNDDTLATAADGRVSLPEPAGGQQLTGLLSAYSDFRFSTALKGGDDWLTAMRFCAAVTRGEDFADPTSFFSAPIDDKNRERAIGLLKSLLDHPSVETAWLRGRLLTPAFDIAPPTSQYEAKQDYFDAAPNGINIRNAWSVYPGSKGLNTKYADLENSWSFDHEDFPQVRDLRSIYYPYGPAHGTAVLGILSGAHNSYGIHGGVPDA
jgi:hypothetical protein